MALQAKCPICRKPTTQGEEYFPFCSERCQIMDLGAWSAEEYRIPGRPVDPIELHQADKRDDEADDR